MNEAENKMVLGAIDAAISALCNLQPLGLGHQDIEKAIEHLRRKEQSLTAQEQRG